MQNLFLIVFAIALLSTQCFSTPAAEKATEKPECDSPIAKKEENEEGDAGNSVLSTEEIISHHKNEKDKSHHEKESIGTGAGSNDGSLSDLQQENKAAIGAQ